MKLTVKLTLAFVLVSLTAIGLAAIFVGMTTSIGFNQYIVDSRQGQFINIVTDYYSQYGQWQGVDKILQKEGLIPPVPLPGSPPPDPQPIALVDMNREVIIPGGQFQAGDKLQKGVIARGIDININGVIVGTVLVTGQAPVKNTIENKYLASVFQSLLVAALGGVLIALLLGLFLARNLTRPVRELTTATHAMAQGKLQQEVTVHSQDELGELAAAFNKMSADLARANQSRRQMTADIAHDLRNPLTVIGGYMESLQDGKLKPTAERFATIQNEVQHLQHLVEDLRTLSLADSGELALYLETVPAGELLEHAASTYQHLADEHGIQIEVEAAAGLPLIKIDPERMEQVLGNLISNSLRYTPDGGRICLQAKTSKASTQGCELVVEDTGSGIAPEIMPFIFERSTRGDDSRSGNGSGLGLAIVRSIIELHGGTIRAESTPGEGTRFVISL